MELYLFLLIVLILGSFGNNVISYYTATSKFDILRSTCPNCGKSLNAWELLPIFSYLILKGKCSGCSVQIPKRYILTEICVLILGMLSFSSTDYFMVRMINFLLIYILFLIAMVDYYTLKIPNLLTLFLLVILIIKSELLFGFDYIDIIGAILLSCTLLATNLLYKKYRNQIAIGLGDIKLLFVLTLVCTWQLSLLGIWLSSIIGLFIHISSLRFKPNKTNYEIKLPFGSYIFLGYSVIILFQMQISTLIQNYIYGI